MPVNQLNSPPAINSHSVFSSARYKIVELFKFLPIRFKLSLIIGAIVILVITSFSIIMLHNQQESLMARMRQICNVLVQNLSETVKGDLLLGKNDKVKEAVLRLKNTDIEGLKQVAVLNRKEKLIAAFDVGGEEMDIEFPTSLLQIKEFTSIARPETFEYYYPIFTQLVENDREKQILLGYAFVSFSRSAILAPIEKVRRIALGSALLIILFSIVGIYLIAKKMTRQIKLLSDGARMVGAGNLNIEIIANSKDELGQLTIEFNKMIQQLREKLQMQKFVSKFTVDMIKDSSGRSSKISRATKRNITVLFSDVRDFSSISEKLKPEAIVKLINVYFDLQTRIIEKHSGMVDKFMGDQIMAIFDDKNMADNALRSAVEIQRQIRTLNQMRQKNGKKSLEMGIGINNGPVVVGHMGSADRMDYTVIGDVVNVAAHLCAQAKAGQIITSFDVAKKVNGSYPTSRLRSTSVKGRTKAIDVCEVDYDREILT